MADGPWLRVADKAAGATSIGLETIPLGASSVHVQVAGLPLARAAGDAGSPEPDLG